MADKKPSGFKTFLLVLVVSVLAVFLGIGAFLIMSPTNNVFGICYISNTADLTKEYADNEDKSKLFNFTKYSTINVTINGGTGNASVHINCGRKDMSNSTIVLKQASKGFSHIDKNHKYNFSVLSEGNILNISVTEPEYDFVQIAKGTVLEINVYETRDDVSGTTFNIKTGAGSVSLGGRVASVNASDCPLKIETANVETQSGGITVKSSTVISSTFNCKTNKGSITIDGNKQISNVSLESTSGKITTSNIIGNVSIKTDNSKVIVGDIQGKVNVDMRSGILSLQNITGDLVSENHLEYTNIRAKTIIGNVTLVSDKKNFGVQIDKIQGNVDVKAGNKDITIGEVSGICDITTTNGSINVTKTDNSNLLRLTSTGGGSIVATFNDLQGENIITTNKGFIRVYFGSNSKFIVTATTESNIYKDWLRTYYSKTLEGDDKYVGGTDAYHNLTLTSSSGPIRLYKVFDANE